MSEKYEDGTYTVEFDDTELDLCLTHRNIMKLDKKLNGINQFLVRASQSMITIDNVVDIVYQGTRKNHEDLTVDSVTEMIFNHGVFDAQAEAIGFLVWSMNGGKEVVDKTDDTVEPSGKK